MVMDPYVIWFVVALALLVIELASTTFYAVFLAAGAAVAGVIAFLVPDSPLWLQGAIAIAVAMAGVVLVRPFVGRRLQRGGGPVGAGVHGSFVGQRALALDQIGDELHPGHVRLAGEVWLAVTDDHSTIDPSAPVVVKAVRGTTLIVRHAGTAPVVASEA
jgi:membrane protein implicated in regulation of membrane protease activity